VERLDFDEAIASTNALLAELRRPDGDNWPTSEDTFEAIGSKMMIALLQLQNKAGYLTCFAQDLAIGRSCKNLVDVLTEVTGCGMLLTGRLKPTEHRDDAVKLLHSLASFIALMLADIKEARGRGFPGARG
jgi:hypothetical protein